MKVESRNNIRGTCPKCGGVTDERAVSWEMRKLIEGAGLLQKDVAAEMKVSQAYLADLLNGRKDWRPELIERLRSAVCNIAIRLGVAK